jgi:hypothetical protein
MEAVALGRLKKNGIFDAISRIGRLTVSKLEELDPRFYVDVSHNAGVTCYIFNPKQPVRMDFAAVIFDGSPLLALDEIGLQKLILSTHARKSAVLKLSLEQKRNRLAINVDDILGELVGGTESITFSGKAFGGVFTIGMTCFFLADERMGCSMNVSVALQPWQGKSVCTLPYFDKAFEFYDHLVKGNKIVGQLEIDGMRAVTVSGSFDSTPKSNPQHALIRYTRNARGLLKFIGTDANFEPEFSATAGEIRFVEETYQMMLVQPKAGGKGLTASSVTMSILPNATRRDLNNMCTVPHAVRIEYEYATPLNLFGREVAFPRIQLTHTMATLKKQGRRDQ